MPRTIKELYPVALVVENEQLGLTLPKTDRMMTEPEGYLAGCFLLYHSTEKAHKAMVKEIIEILDKKLLEEDDE